jgi:hypothetical protein
MNQLSVSLLTRIAFILTSLFTNITRPNAVALPDGSLAGPAGVTNLPTLAQFVRQVTNGNAAQVTGVYVENVFALPVVQQPTGNPAYISTQPDTLTEFSLSLQYGSLGFVAHNTLAGALFTKLAAGNLLVIINGDGSQQSYQVNQVRHFKANDPNSPYSSYVDLDQGGLLTYSDLFFQTYGQKGTAILQTCIAADGVDSWGRLFVIASPYTPAQFPIPGKQ